MSAERFLRWLVDHLCSGGLTFPMVDPAEVFRATDALKTALEIAGNPLDGQAQAVLGWTIGCSECSWRGIAFSRHGAVELQGEHSAHEHTPAYRKAI